MSLYDVRGVKDLPFIAISVLDFGSFGIGKYIFPKEEETITTESILKFVDDARSKTIDPYYKSEDIPSEADF